jgi:tRNA (guanine37-N1)-methyltransferase
MTGSGKSLILNHQPVVMRIDIITVLPELLESPLRHSIIKRATDKSLVEIHLHDLREYGFGKHRQVDDYTYGNDAGMVLMIEPVDKCISALKNQRHYDEVIYTSPDGELFDQPMANTMSLHENIIILCGHYKGIDQRIRDCLITKEISIGNYVLTGGELAAAVIVDGIVRLIPGVLSDETSALSDSFQDKLLSPPVYTRPAEYKGMKVPDVLTSGNFKLIDAWKEKQAWERTKKLRPELLNDKEKNDE